MNLIRCSSNCVYQNDGLCTLEKPEKVTGKSEGCCYYISKSDHKNNTQLKIIN